MSVVRTSSSNFRRIMSAVGIIRFIAQGGMRAKPEMKPWVHTDKNRMSSAGAALTARAFTLRLGSAAPLGLNKCVSIITQGSRPGLCRSIAPLGLFNNNSNKMNTSYLFQ